MPFQKGHPPYSNRKGKIVSVETRKKMSDSHKGKHYSPDTEFKKGMTTWHKGKKIDRKKFPTYGHLVPHSQESIKKMSLIKKGKHFSPNTEFKEKEGELGYFGLHEWVQKRLGKAKKCSINPNHVSTVYYWANISGEYKKELSDWRESCPRCNKNDGIKMHPRFQGDNYGK